MGGDQTWFCAEFDGPVCDGLSSEQKGCRCTNPQNDSARNKSIVHILKTIEAFGVTGRCPLPPFPSDPPSPPFPALLTDIALVRG